MLVPIGWGIRCSPGWALLLELLVQGVGVVPVVRVGVGVSAPNQPQASQVSGGCPAGVDPADCVSK